MSSVNKQTNNSLYEKKHRYMFILKELSILKNQIDNEVLNEGLPKVYATEIRDIYTRIIVGLLEEGVSYQFVKDATDPKKNLIRVPVDGSYYECRNIDVREILEDRYDEIMNIQYDGPTFKEIQQSRKQNNDTRTNNTGDMANLIAGFTEALTESIASPVNRQTTSNVDDEVAKITDAKKIKAEVERELIQKYMPPKVYLNEKEEKKEGKKKSSFLRFISSLIVTLILLGGLCAFAYSNSTIRNSIESGWNKIINQQDSDEKDEKVTNRKESEKNAQASKSQKQNN